MKQHVFDRNPARLIDNLDRSERHHRRPFTLEELTKLLAAAPEDWKTAILFGIYTGLRLTDITNLCWKDVDLDRQEVGVLTKKTGRNQVLPIAAPLQTRLKSMKDNSAGTDPIMTTLHGRTESRLSNEFYEIMAAIDLVKSRANHGKRKEGRDSKREQSPITFHSLRHTATSLLKNAGVSDAVARDIIGHESAAISQNYTHISMDAKRTAIEKLPDVTVSITPDGIKLKSS